MALTAAHTDDPPQAHPNKPLSPKKPLYLERFENPTEGLITWADAIEALQTLKTQLSSKDFHDVFQPATELLHPLSEDLVETIGAHWEKLFELVADNPHWQEFKQTAEYLINFSAGVQAKDYRKSNAQHAENARNLVAETWKEHGELILSLRDNKQC
ncbi:hypothetical protein BJX62DRAFT_232938 [Aspergillus germanicus]